MALAQAVYHRLFGEDMTLRDIVIEGFGHLGATLHAKDAVVAPHE